MKTIIPSARGAFALLLLAAIFLVSNSVRAQDTSSNQYKCALQFQIGPNFQLASFNGATISFKYLNSEKSAIRFGVMINGYSNNIDFNGDYITGDSSKVGDYKQSRYNITLNVQYLLYENIFDKVSFFYGGGPLFGLSGSLNNPNNYYYYYGNYKEQYNNKVSGWNAGLSAVCGVEWRLANRLSVSGEYELSFIYGYSKETYEDETRNISYKSTGYNVNGNSVKLGLSLYF